MPRKKRKPPAKVGRPAKPEQDRKRHVLSIRVQDELHFDLMETAKKARRSMSDEIAYRLNSAATVERALGGRGTRDFTMQMVGDFLFVGNHESQLRLGPDAERGAWLRDVGCYDAAILALVEFLFVKRPDRSRDSEVRFFYRLKARILTRWANEDLQKEITNAR